MPEPAVKCTADAVERNKTLVQTFEINGTPALIREDGIVLSGFLPEDRLLKWIDNKK